MGGKGARRASVVAAVVLCLALTGTLSSSALASAVTPSVRIELRGMFSLGRAMVTVPWRGVHVVGWVRPYVPGQVVRVFLLEHGKVLKDKRLRIRSGPRGQTGWFRVRVASPIAGHIRIDVIHAATRQMSHFIVPRKIEVLNPQAGFGSSGAFVRLIQQRLSFLHFYRPQTGVYDSGTGLAVGAWQRLLSWGAYQPRDTRT